MMILCFASFYPKFQEKKRRKLTFLSLLNTRERFFSKRTSSSSVRFMTMLLEERDERISDDIDDDCDEY